MQTEGIQKFNRFREFKLYKAILTLVLFIIICGAVITGGILCFIIGDRDTKPAKSDVMIVLGCQIKRCEPSLSLKYRLDKASELYKKGYAEYIIVSGGQGSDEQFTEAYIMKKWLSNKGVNADKIIEEDKSTSTFENLKYSKRIMEERNFKTAVIVSNDFHMFRVLRLAENLKIKASGGPAPTVGFLKLHYYSREILAVIKSFLFDR